MIGLAVAFRPDGHEVAVATLNVHLTFFETQTAQQVGCIEARHDLGYARSETDKVTAKKLASNRHAFFPNLSSIFILLHTELSMLSIDMQYK